MLICIFGESCTGKSTLAEQIRQRTGATIYSGRDYLRLAKSEAAAKEAFCNLLSAASNAEETTIYVVAEMDCLALLPQHCIRVLMTEELSVIKERFAKRTGGKLPPPVAAMLERKHNCFDHIPHDFHIHSGNGNVDEILTWKNA